MTGKHKNNSRRISSAFTIPRKTAYLECVVKYRLLIGCGKSWEGEKNCVPFVYRIPVYHASYYDSSNILVCASTAPAYSQLSSVFARVLYHRNLKYVNALLSQLGATCQSYMQTRLCINFIY